MITPVRKEFPLRLEDCVVIPFMVRGPHHERDRFVGKYKYSSFALSFVEGLRANCDTIP
jgi:hypothetical protein